MLTGAQGFVENLASIFLTLRGCVILYKTDHIREKIRAVLSAKNGKRYAIVAFVGKDALDFVLEPNGLIVYCWPNVAATNPDGIKSLMNAGAYVYFVERLHMKLFWSERGGAIIGSCNLSKNALDSGASSLRELAYFVADSADVRIKDVLHDLKPTLVTAEILADYRKKYSEAAARSDEYKRGKTKNLQSLPTFGAFVEESSSDQRIIVCYVDTFENKIPGPILDAVRKADARATDNPGKFIADYTPSRIKPSKGDWMLCCKVGKSGSYGRLMWSYTHLVTKRRANDPNWISVEFKKNIEDPPFDAREKRFVEAFRRFAENVDLVKTEAFILTAPRLAKLAACYNAIG